MWKHPQLASKRSVVPLTGFVQDRRWMSDVPAGQELLAAFSTAWGSNSRPWSRTCAAVREWSSSVGSHAIPDPQ